MAELRVSRNPDDVLVTYALGSCLGVMLWDPIARVGGMLHVMLPESSLEPERARVSPAMFMDTGLPALFRACYAEGAVKQRMIVRVAGGAATSAGPTDMFQIGKRNMIKLREMLWRNGVLLRAHDVGGVASRTVLLDVGTGTTVVRSKGRELQL